jgi:ankyrin repeat protein
MGPLPRFTANFYADKLIQAVLQGRIQDVGRLLDKGADANHRDKFGRTALTHAAEAGHLEVMGLLLEAGAQVKADDAALFQACCKGGLPVARTLFRHLPDAHSRDMFLVAAATEASLDVVSFLIDRGADVNAADSHGWTALMMASMEGHLEIARFLLNKGAQVNGMDEYGGTALMAACQLGRHDVAALLIDRDANVNARALGSPVPLSKYGDPANRIPPGMTSLSWACRNGHSSTVDLLLTHGAAADVTDGEGWTPLMWAALGGHASIVETLLSKGAAPCASTTALSTGLFAQATTGLMMAAHRGHSEVVDVLLDNGADITTKDRNGKTALMFAARGGHLDAVNVLLQRSATIDDKNHEGLSALAYALIERHRDVAEALREKGAEEPVVSKKAVSLRDRVPIPSIARVSSSPFLLTTALTVSTLALLAIGALFLAHGDFSAQSLMEQRYVGRPLSSLFGFFAWLVSDEANALMVGGWTMVTALVLSGLVVQFCRRMSQSRQWDALNSPRLGAAASIGGLTLFGSAALLSGLCFYPYRGDTALGDGLGVFSPGYFICVGAFVLAFAYSGRERFGLLRIAGLSIVLYLAGFTSSALTGEFTSGSLPKSLSFFGLAAVLLYMGLMVRIDENSVLLDKSLLRMLGRAVLLLPVLVAAFLIVSLHFDWP